jgi:PAS domain S-box-containing protein
VKPPLAKKSELAEQLDTVAACAAAAPGIIATLRRSPDGTDCFPYVSENFTDLYGFDPEDVKTDITCIAARRHPEDRARYEAAIAESARTLSMLHEEFRWEHPWKGMIWLEVRANPVAEPDGGVLWRGYIQDITERKRAEACYRALFDSNLIGVCHSRRVNGVDGLVTAANDKYLEIIGCDREDLAAGRVNWVNLTAPEFQHVNQAAIPELATRGRTQHPLAKEYVRKDGTRAPVVVTCAVLDKVAPEGIAFVLDRSEQKNSELRIRQLHADRVALIQSMSAEINQPLAATVAYLGAARRLLDIKSEKRQTIVAETLGKASEQIVRAGKIISQLRSFIARSDTDQFPVNARERLCRRLPRNERDAQQGDSRS